MPIPYAADDEPLSPFLEPGHWRLVVVLRCVGGSDGLGLEALAAAMTTLLVAIWFRDNRPSLHGPVGMFPAYALFKIVNHSILSAKAPAMVDRRRVRRAEAKHVSPLGRRGPSSDFGIDAWMVRNAPDEAIRSLDAHRAFWLDPESHDEERSAAVGAFRRAWTRVPQGT